MARISVILLLANALLLSACQDHAQASEPVVSAPAAKVIAQEQGAVKTAYFAGGCFWGVEGVFSHVKGVKSVISGYHGGKKSTAQYARVSSGATRHVEAVKVVYNPRIVRYDQLLRIFFSVVADPTLHNRQGPDRGPQYNAELIPADAQQHRVATAYLRQMQQSGTWSAPIVTKVAEPATFYRAEAKHQDFMLANPRHPYILRWDKPKVSALKRLYPTLYRARYQPG